MVNAVDLVDIKVLNSCLLKCNMLIYKIVYKCTHA